MPKYTSAMDDMIANDSTNFKHVPRSAGSVYRKYLGLSKETSPVPAGFPSHNPDYLSVNPDVIPYFILK